MTGAYTRVQRDGRWLNIEVEFLTDAEREAFFKSKTHDELVRWINLLCNVFADNIDKGEPE